MKYEFINSGNIRKSNIILEKRLTFSSKNISGKSPLQYEPAGRP